MIELSRGNSIGPLKAALIETRAKLSGAHALIEHLQLGIAKMKREMFGPRSERSQRTDGRTQMASLNASLRLRSRHRHCDASGQSVAIAITTGETCGVPGIAQPSIAA